MPPFRDALAKRPPEAKGPAAFSLSKVVALFGPWLMPARKSHLTRAQRFWDRRVITSLGQFSRSLEREHGEADRRGGPRGQAREQGGGHGRAPGGHRPRSACWALGLSCFELSGKPPSLEPQTWQISKGNIGPNYFSGHPFSPTC